MQFHLKELTETGQVEEFLAELQQQLAQSYPIKLFTLSVIDMANQQARRMYSSQPDIYPVGGMKPFPENFFNVFYTTLYDLVLKTLREELRQV